MEEEEAGGGETKQDTNKVAKDDIELFRSVAFKCVTLQEKGQNLHCYRGCNTNLRVNSSNTDS